MNPKIEVFYLGESIFKGTMLTLPFKAAILKEKGMELFSDDEPCAIQQSQIKRTLIGQMMPYFNDELRGIEHPDMFAWLDFEHPESLVIKKRSER